MENKIVQLFTIGKNTPNEDLINLSSKNKTVNYSSYAEDKTKKSTFLQVLDISHFFHLIFATGI